jgi:hypothetical protein
MRRGGEEEQNKKNENKTVKKEGIRRWKRRLH